MIQHKDDPTIRESKKGSMLGGGVFLASGAYIMKILEKSKE
jgi:hypothetical protein